MLALSRGVVPPTLNLERPDPSGFGFEHVRLGSAPLGERRLRAALCNSFGFGGMNASALFLAPGDDLT